ncbi:hypothetical protein F7725_015888 [Dissostichus mawsoni]|uniref:Uncharacterized protein n=1 Tax=Dissostichus mawsoni TaxID=36200 RepID=A0A7J5YKB4_DISMA|nr:hypothetical protein F7725_015888 [Dissostichus mawsoni]
MRLFYVAMHRFFDAKSENVAMSLLFVTMSLSYLAMFRLYLAWSLLYMSLLYMSLLYMSLLNMAMHLLYMAMSLFFVAMSLFFVAMSLFFVAMSLFFVAISFLCVAMSLSYVSPFNVALSLLCMATRWLYHAKSVLDFDISLLLVAMSHLYVAISLLSVAMRLFNVSMSFLYLAMSLFFRQALVMVKTSQDRLHCDWMVLVVVMLINNWMMCGLLWDWNRPIVDFPPRTLHCYSALIYSLQRALAVLARGVVFTLALEVPVQQQALGGVEVTLTPFKREENTQMAKAGPQSSHSPADRWDRGDRNGGPMNDGEFESCAYELSFSVPPRAGLSSLILRLVKVKKSLNPFILSMRVYRLSMFCSRGPANTEKRARTSNFTFLSFLEPTQREYSSVQMTRVMLAGERSATSLGCMLKASMQSSA